MNRIANDVMIFYLKANVRRMSYPYKYYLTKIHIKDDIAYLELKTKDKMKENIIINTEWPLKGIVKNLKIYIDWLRESILKQWPKEDEIPEKITRKFIDEQLKLNEQ